MIPTASQTYVKTDMGDSLNSFVDEDEIPEDAEMAETLYFLEGFESGGILHYFKMIQSSILL